VVLVQMTVYTSHILSLWKER